MKIVRNILPIHRYYFNGVIEKKFMILTRVKFLVLRDIQMKDGFECLVPSPFLKQSANI